MGSSPPMVCTCLAFRFCVSKHNNVVSSISDFRNLRSDPFKIDWTAFGPEEEGGVRRIHLNQIVTFVFKHYTCDWQGLPPFKVIMYSVKDPVSVGLSKEAKFVKF